MQRAIFPGPGQKLVIEQCDITPPGPDDVLLKVARCGICGSDISMTDDSPFSFAPGPIGHEYAGEIVEVGANVTHLRPGDRVACLPTAPCGTCVGCRSGNVVLCHSPLRSANGSSGFGGFGEYVTVPAIVARRLPETLSLADGAMIEPMACGLHAVRRAALAAGARVLVLGAGTMALSVVYWAQALGAERIVVASRSNHRRELAGCFGADEFLTFDDLESNALSRLLHGPADIVAECVGKAGMLDRALGFAGPAGTVISLGMCQCAEAIQPAALNFRDAKLVFPIAYTVAEFEETARAFDSTGFHPGELVSDVIPLRQLPSVLEELRTGSRRSLKIQVDPTGGE